MSSVNLSNKHRHVDSSFHSSSQPPLNPLAMAFNLLYSDGRRPLNQYSFCRLVRLVSPTDCSSARPVDRRSVSRTRGRSSESLSDEVNPDIDKVEMSQ